MKTFKVAKIIDSSTIYITGGRADGLKKGDKFKISSPDGLEIKDPDSGEILEVVPGLPKATVSAQNVFEKVTMVAPVSSGMTFPLNGENLFSVNPLQITGSPVRDNGSNINIGDIVLYSN
mgnify:CR=1 FL=1